MQITREQVGSSLRFLECQLAGLLSQHPIALPDFLTVEAKLAAPLYGRKPIDSGH